MYFSTDPSQCKWELITLFFTFLMLLHFVKFENQKKYQMVGCLIYIHQQKSRIVFNIYLFFFTILFWTQVVFFYFFYFLLETLDFFKNHFCRLQSLEFFCIILQFIFHPVGNGENENKFITKKCRNLIFKVESLEIK